MSAVELRPMGIGDILDVTFRLYRRRFLTFLLIALVVYIPYALLMALIQAPNGQIAVGSAAGQAAFGVLPFLVGMIGFAVFALVMLPLCGAAMVHNISASYLGEELTASGSYGRAAPRLFRLLIAQFLAGIIMFVGFLLLIVPGVIFSLWFFVLMPVVMLEGLGGTAALGRSRELTRGNLGKAFTLGFLVTLLTLLITSVLSMVGRAIPWPHTAFLIFFNNLLPALVLPIQTAPVILLYYDLRIRKEAFDLQKLSEALGQTAAP